MMNIKEGTVELGLVKGRHEIPGIEEYIFETVEDVLDFKSMHNQVHSKLSHHDGGVVVYVTGLTACLVEVINYCTLNLIPLTLMHWDRETGNYVPQTVLSDCHYGDLREGGYVR